MYIYESLIIFIDELRYIWLHEVMVVMFWILLGEPSLLSGTALILAETLTR